MKFPVLLPPGGPPAATVGVKSEVVNDGTESKTSRRKWRRVVKVIARPALLPVFDPEWARQCRQCRHVHLSVSEGVQILRCRRSRVVGGGGQQREQLRQYCLEVLTEECAANGWFEPEQA